jgi:ABC-type sugar transport system ATPase subunit
MTPALQLLDLELSHRRTPVLRGLSLDVLPGELLAVVGPSGSGKTSMLRAVAGLEPLDGGRVLLDGEDVTGTAPGRRDVAMVFQDLALLPHLDVAGNIGFGQLARGGSRRAVRAQVREVAADFGLTDLLRRRVTRLSGGEQQRVALARAVVRRPAAYLLDEPLSSLDPVLREEARAQVQVLRGRSSAPVVLVTHDPHEALAMGDRVAVLRDGVIVQVGTPDEVYERPADVFVARFVGPLPMNLLAHGDGHVGVRPERVRLGAASGDALAGTVERVEHAGHEAVVHAATERGPVVARVAWAARPAVGARVGLGWDSADLHAFGSDGRRLR